MLLFCHSKVSNINEIQVAKNLFQFKLLVDLFFNIAAIKLRLCKSNIKLNHIAKTNTAKSG